MMDVLCVQLVFQHKKTQTQAQTLQNYKPGKTRQFPSVLWMAGLAAMAGL
jgi:hypothetical protein